MIDLKSVLLQESKQNMLTDEGRNSLHDGDIDMIADVISVSIVGGAWAAMDEWGTGSKMDTSNPAFPDYLASEMWNPARTGTTIVSRPNQPGQKDIFGNPVNGVGAGGVDLEALGKVEPQIPSHAIRTAAEWLRNGEMQSTIRSIVASFPFDRYIICDTKKK